MKADTYRAVLRRLPPPEWDAYLLAESDLPGPRANLELLQVAADEGGEEGFRRWLALDATQTPPETAREFLPACGAVGLGRLAAEGRRDVLADLRRHAGDSRWRVREGVAMGLQRLGAANMRALIVEMRRWSRGSWLERRAAVAALCEPGLLRQAAHARAVLNVLDSITESIQAAPPASRRDSAFRVLRQALGYGWSVAVVALPQDGREQFERWLGSADADVRWIVRENLKKARLTRLDPAWVARCLAARPAPG
ncbi:MAG TPA: hypothetical protein VFN74_08180 [Chloroflexota bacterium]|nr:hypothetical protein [Chloroflexota bacterium]